MTLLLFTFTCVSAQVNDAAETIQTGKQEEIQALHVLVKRRKFTVPDSSYMFNTRDIDAIYRLDDRQKSIEKFGQQGQYGALIISPKKRQLSRFLKSMGIIYPLPEVQYGRKGPQTVQ